MSFFKKLLGVALPVIGGAVAGPAGAAIGGTLGGAVSKGISTGSSAIGSMIGGMEQASASREATDLAYERNSAEAALQRNWASQEASTARQFNELQAQKQMDFQERLSSSAHQREVADLRAAGLNPVLSGTGGMGSSTPVGASAHAAAPSGSSASTQAQQVFDIITPALSTAMNLSVAQAEIARKEAETAEVEARTPTHEQERERLKAATANLAADTQWKAVLKDRTSHEVEKTKWEAKRAFEEIYETYWSAVYKQMLAKRTKAEITTAEIEARTMMAIEDADLNELLKAYPMLSGLGNVLKPLFIRAMSK